MNWLCAWIRYLISSCDSSTGSTGNDVHSSMAPKHNVNVIIPHAAAIPSNFDMLHAAATLAVVPSKSDSRVIRADYISSLIDAALAQR